MAKGSVRKKGKKWYYRFYIEDESGNRVQKEYPGTESKSETEALLRRAMEDYEEKRFVAKAENITVGDMLDMWVEEELKPGTLSNGTVMAYQGYQAAPPGQAEAENRHRRPSASLHRLHELRRRQSRWNDLPAHEPGLYAPILSGTAKLVPLRRVP